MDVDDSILQQEEQQQEVERVVELACKSLSPRDAVTLRWATGMDEKDSWVSDSSAKPQERF